ncbi:HTH_XRE domain containing protein [uncultured Caudovirales phage]|uniref:HTH_XRE domain containing protein n=1 Tax=uncultured Caudovirales phage TaxID=2100421 RepID=A0A6J5L7H4_9CAUD|nr:HTH_XRE domain containing protein [uncultured Caudovirales phage]
MGALFRAERRRNRVWLKDMAKALGVSVNTIRWHENGARMMRSDLLVRAAEIMGVDPAILLRAEQPKEDNQ